MTCNILRYYTYVRYNPQETNNTTKSLKLCTVLLVLGMYQSTKYKLLTFHVFNFVHMDMYKILLFFHSCFSIYVACEGDIFDESSESMSHMLHLTHPEIIM
jgi:hypothetical protein